MHKLPLAALAASLFLSVAPSLAETRSLDTGPFKAIIVETGIEADVVVGGPLSIEAEGDFTDLRHQVTDDVLKIWYDWNVFQLFSRPEHDLKLTINVPALTDVTGTTAARLDVKGVFGDLIRAEATTGAAVALAGASATSYALSATTGATLTVDGACIAATTVATTGSSLQAAKLACKQVTAEATTGSSLVISATESIAGEATTGASITVHGRPRINQLEADTGASVHMAQ